MDPNNPQLIRDAVDYSKTIAGDMRRVGASGLARVFDATFPFSAATLQSWNSIGRAIKYNPVRFTAGAAAIIGVPTMSELAYNASLSAAFGTFKDAGGKEWTYDDYYWNGFTTQQRNDNFIYFVPGRDPWDAVLVPVTAMAITTDDIESKARSKQCRTSSWPQQQTILQWRTCSHCCPRADEKTISSIPKRVVPR